MKLLSTSVLILIFTFQNLIAQINPADTSLYCTVYQIDGSNYDMYLCKIDYGTGLCSKISTLPVATSLYTQHGATIDPFKNIFYFTDGTHLISVDIVTGNLLNSITLINGDYEDFIEMHFNYGDSTIYALNNITFPVSEYRIAKIDPATGLVTDVNTTPTGLKSNVNAYTIDAINKRVYLSGTSTSPDDSLFIMDLATGLIEARMPISFDGVYNNGNYIYNVFNNFCFDNLHNKLYGGYRNEGVSTNEMIAEINTNTAAATAFVASSFSDLISNAFQAADIDPLKGIFFKQSHPTELVQLDCISGNPIADNIVILPFNQGAYNFNVIYPYYLSSVVGEETISKSLPRTELFPNPSSDFIQLKSGLSTGTKFEISILDILGRTIKHENLTAENDGSPISIEKLSSGIYFLRVNADGKNQTLRFCKA